jgi:hypothetical protein
VAQAVREAADCGQHSCWISPLSWALLPAGTEKPEPFGAWAGWKKVEMRYWVYVADLGNDRYWVGVGKREQLWGANIDPIIMQPARAKAEAMYLLADTSDRILANGFKCNAIRGNSRIGLPSAPKSGVQLSLSG